MARSRATLPPALLPSLAGGIAGALLAIAPAASQDPPTLEQRVERLERENRELRESVGAELERMQHGGDLIPEATESRWGLGPAASKIYQQKEGVSIGGYGEMLFQQRSGDTDVLDAQRAIVYFGYRFDDKFLFNSEVEIEHGTTDASSGTTSGSGSVSLEFGYLDYLHAPALNLRAGLLLVPMGFLNELHEPTTFLGANRPRTEQMIIPSTWRAGGAGIFGESGGFSYRAYAINSLDGDEFGAGGLRGGRQKGNRAAADDIAFVGRLDWIDLPGLTLGGSLFWGKTGQDGLDDAANPIPAMATTIAELHAEFREGPWRLRGLYSSAFIDDAGAFNTSTGNNLAQRLDGWYVEAGFDVLAEFVPDCESSLTPFLRYERVDTQASMPAGFTADPTRDETIWTLGLDYKPIDRVVVKLDFEHADEGDDRFNLLFGYVF